VLFAVHVTVTVPEPVDELGVTESHVAAFEAALQEPSWQPGGFPVTVRRVEPSAAPGAIEVGLIEKLVHGGADCITVKVSPAMVAVPVRDSSAEFWVHPTVTTAEPEPLVGVTLSHVSFARVVQLPPVQP
jgi:hypothetical protein